MPHRLLNVTEAAAYLHLSPVDVVGLAKGGDIPHVKQGGRLVFRRAEIDSWASQRILRLPAQRLADYHARTSFDTRVSASSRLSMPELITRDRIQPALCSRTKASMIRDMVCLAERTDLVSDAHDLLRLIEERERLCSTALSNGLALLHPRHHTPYMFTDSFIVLGRTIHPIHCGSQDGAPTDIFFLVCCENERGHLHTLARLCTMCMQTRMLDDLRTQETPDGMLNVICAAEEQVLRHL